MSAHSSSSGSDAARSLAVLKRFGLKLLLFSGWATLQGALGHDGLRQFSSLVLLAAMLCQVIGVWRQEHVRSPYWTCFDEAAWFLLLGLALDRFSA